MGNLFFAKKSVDSEKNSTFVLKVYIY